MGKNLYEYMATADAKGYDASRAYTALTGEFEKGNVTYPRADGITHPEIVIIRKSINSTVKALLEEEIPLEREFSGKIHRERFLLLGKYSLSTPASLSSDWKRYGKRFAPERGSVKAIKFERYAEYRLSVEKERRMATHEEIWKNYKTKGRVETDVSRFKKRREREI